MPPLSPGEDGVAQQDRVVGDIEANDRIAIAGPDGAGEDIGVCAHIVRRLADAGDVGRTRERQVFTMGRIGADGRVKANASAAGGSALPRLSTLTSATQIDLKSRMTAKR